MSDFLFCDWVARVSTAVVAAMLARLWFAMPTVCRITATPDEPR